MEMQTAVITRTMAMISLLRNDNGRRTRPPTGWMPGASTGSGCRLEDIPETSHGVDHRLAAGVDLLAQVGDVKLDDVRLAAEVVVPHPVEDLRLGQHAPRVAHEVAQQLELGRGEVDLLAAAGHLVAVLVEGEVADDEH